MRGAPALRVLRVFVVNSSRSRTPKAMIGVDTRALHLGEKAWKVWAPRPRGLLVLLCMFT